MWIHDRIIETATAFSEILCVAKQSADTPIPAVRNGIGGTRFTAKARTVKAGIRVAGPKLKESASVSLNCGIVSWDVVMDGDVPCPINVSARSDRTRAGSVV